MLRPELNLALSTLFHIRHCNWKNVLLRWIDLYSTFKTWSQRLKFYLTTIQGCVGELRIKMPSTYLFSSLLNRRGCLGFLAKSLGQSLAIPYLTCLLSDCRHRFYSNLVTSLKSTVEAQMT